MIILSCGLLRLLFHWKPHWMLNLTHVKCPLDCAKKVLLVVSFSNCLNLKNKKNL